MLVDIEITPVESLIWVTLFLFLSLLLIQFTYSRSAQSPKTAAAASDTAKAAEESGEDDGARGDVGGQLQLDVEAQRQSSDEAYGRLYGPGGEVH